MDRFQPPAEPDYVTDCAHCNGEIYAGDEVRTSSIDNWRICYVHEDCAKDYAFDRTFDGHGVILRDLTVD